MLCSLGITGQITITVASIIIYSSLSTIMLVAEYDYTHDRIAAQPAPLNLPGYCDSNVLATSLACNCALFVRRFGCYGSASNFV